MTKGIDIVPQMQKLRDMLDERSVDWQDVSDTINDDDFICRTWFEVNGNKVSVINGFGTYGGYFGANINADRRDENLGLLECMISGHEPVGWLTAEEVLKYISEELNDVELDQAEKAKL